MKTYSNDLGSKLDVPMGKPDPFYSVKFLEKTGEDGSNRRASHM
jgi:hypothetical protein